MRGVVLHEIGHTLSFWTHSGANCNVMTTGGTGWIPDDEPLAPLITDEEAIVAGVVRQLPLDFYMWWYVRE